MTKPVFTARIDSANDVHTHITVFNRGANCGTLTVLTEDADELIRRISGIHSVTQNAGTVSGTMIGTVIGKL